MRTAEDPAALIAQCLSGHLFFHPNGHRGGLNPETLPLIDALTAANHAATLTDNSQPAELAVFHGHPWYQRAFVTAFVADPELARALATHAVAADLVVRVYRPRSRVDENAVNARSST
ncbi:hypothetical protein O3S80_07120 [Streptomyces sp. Lzd4kr]|nr:hypothetical protein [Streptomyces sp. Lzd4kr]